MLTDVINAIEESERVLILTHVNPDGDAIGSTKGLQRILKLTYPEKTVLLINDDYADYLSFLGGEDEPIKDEEYADALGLVLDTGTAKRISNQKYSLCREVIKIDHHIPIESYGNYQWVEEERSSTCEMIAHFYDTFSNELKIDTEAATYIYAGMVTDSGRFRFRDVSSETMRLASVILKNDIDTDVLFANLYMKDFSEFKFEAYAHKKMKITENGVAYLFVTKKMQKKLGITKEQASASVSFMDSIKGSLIWIAFIEGEKEIRVRLRSRFVKISDLAEQYRGGGHACAAGATVMSKTEMKELISKADALLGEYKATNEGWL